MVKIQVPSQDYKVKVWNKEKKSFTDTVFDIFEQKHWNDDGQTSTDFEANFLVNMLPDETTIVKMIQAPNVEKPKKSLAE